MTTNNPPGSTLGGPQKEDLPGNNPYPVPTPPDKVSLQVLEAS